MAPPDGAALAVDPAVYYAAAKSLVALAGDISTTVNRDLVPGLKTTAGMGGNYPAVAGWNAAYRKHAGDVRTAILAYAAALSHFSDILNIAGYNWDAAEYNSNPSSSKGDPPVRPVLGTAQSMPVDAFPEIPDPNGDNGAGLVIAPGWQSPTPWTGAPNGRADALTVASTAWDAFAFGSELLTAPLTLLDVRNSFTVVQAPEVPDIAEALDALRSGAEEISNVACALATKTAAYQTNLVDARNQLASAALGAFPTHPDAQVTAMTVGNSVRVAVAASLSMIDVLNAANTFNVTARNTALFTDLSHADYAKNGFTGSDALSALPKLQALAALPLLVESGNQGDNTALHGELDNMATWKTPVKPQPLTEADLNALNQYGPQMKRWAMLAVQYGNDAGVDPRLVLAMALQEGAPLRSGLEGDFYPELNDSRGPSAYQPHSGVGAAAGLAWDEARLNASRLGVDKNGAGNSIGLTNQKQGPFEEVKAKYPEKFKGQEWSDLVGNDDLAMKAAAYNLKMLNDDAAVQATPEVRASQPLNQFLGSGYNAGGMDARSLSVAEQHLVPGQNGAPVTDTFTPSEEEHGRSTVDVVRLANTILCGSGAYR
ncbi:hypothetical protein ACWEOI_31020 [Nocardia sp. NPDC004340]